MTDDTFNLSLTRAEANDLGQLIDIAVRAQGMNAARAGVHFTDKMEAAARQARDAAMEAEIDARAEALVAAREAEAETPRP